jgi:hypothetical protein
MARLAGPAMHPVRAAEKLQTNKDWETLIHEIARNAKRLIFTRHVLEQMRVREVTMAMALDTLRAGRIVRPPRPDDNTGDM